MAEIKLENIYKSYDGENYALKDINLEIHDGEFVVLVGPSGCGKSTLLRMIAGLEDITKGNIYINGEKANHISPKDRDLAMVFQSYALYPNMTVYENMAYPLKLRKMDREEMDEIIQRVSRNIGISEYLDRKPGQLSGGQRQRVALGRCIVRSPLAFLMDEPLSNLDAKLRVQTRTEISALQKEMKKTFIYVTHDQIEAMTMGDRIIVMEGGVIQQIDTAENLYENPKNKFVASFIGSPEMNFQEFSSGVLNFNGVEVDVNYDKALWQGIRPEKISLVPNDGFSFPAEIMATEVLGAENYIYIQVNDETFLVRDFDLVEVKVGETRDFYIRPEEMRLFDKETERLLRINF